MASILDEVYGETEPQKGVLDEVYAEKPGGIGGLVEAPKAVMGTFARTGKLGFELSARLKEVPYVGVWPWQEKEKQVAEAGELAQEFREAEKYWKPTHAGPIAWTARTAGQAIGSSIQAITVAALGGVPLAAAFIGTLKYQEAYDEAKARGASETAANIEGVASGAAEAALEYWGLDRLLKFKESGKASAGALIRNIRGKLWEQAKGDAKNITFDMLKAATTNAIQEASQEGASLAVPAIISKEWPKKPDGSPDWNRILTEYPKQVLEAGLGGAVAGGFMVGAGALPKGLHEAAMPTVPKILEAARQVQTAEGLTPYQRARSLDDLKQMMPDTGAVQTTKSSPAAEDPFAVPENVRQVLNIADKLQGELELLYTRKGKKERAAGIKAKRGEMFAARELKAEELEKQGLSETEIIARLLASEKGTLKEQIDYKEPFTVEDIGRLELAVRESNIFEGTKSTLYDAIKELLVDQVPTSTSRIRAFDNFFGTNILEVSKGRPDTAWQKVIEACNAYKAVRASFDHSMVLRQGIWLFQNHPLKGIVAAGKGLRAAVSKEYYRLADVNMRIQPYFQLSQEARLAYTEVGKRLKSEEQFISQYAHRGRIGKWVAASDRAATTTLNQLRQSVWNMYCRDWEGYNKSPEAYKELAEYLNHATGRATYGRKQRVQDWFQRHMPTLNAIFWSPQLTMGTVQTHMDLITKPHIRKIVAGDILQFYGQSLLALTLFSMIPGIKVERDPRSSDFGKIRCGNIRVDFLGPRTQLVRMIAQMLSGKKKLTASEQIYNIKWQQPLWQFLRSKLGPAPQIGADILRGKTFEGRIARWTEPEFIADYLKEHIPPLVFTDLIDAIETNGFGAAAAVGPMAFFGIGTQVYEDTATGTERQVKNQYAHEIFGCDWNDLGPEVQEELRRNRPIIKVWEDKSKYERENYDFVGMINQESFEAGRRIQRSLSNKVQKELGAMEVKIGNIPRRIGSDWYINEKRFAKYEKNLRETLDKVLGEVISQPGWNEADPAAKKLYLEQAIKDIKTHVRGELINTADSESILKYEDLQRIQP